MTGVHDADAAWAMDETNNDPCAEWFRDGVAWGQKRIVAGLVTELRLIADQLESAHAEATP